ncbi:hypothetical protein B0H11DRAFT_2256988 [Mycena galericulata]|nr:hypothetical protein B0H11DRAFT_2256988 [Mycena galericulata]
MSADGSVGVGRNRAQTETILPGDQSMWDTGHIDESSDQGSDRGNIVDMLLPVNYANFNEPEGSPARTTSRKFTASHGKRIMDPVTELPGRIGATNATSILTAQKFIPKSSIVRRLLKIRQDPLAHFMPTEVKPGGRFICVAPPGVAPELRESFMRPCPFQTLPHKRPVVSPQREIAPRSPDTFDFSDSGRGLDDYLFDSSEVEVGTLCIAAPSITVPGLDVTGSPMMDIDNDDFEDKARSFRRHTAQILGFIQGELTLIVDENIEGKSLSFLMVYKRTQLSSDYDPDFQPPPKRFKKALSLPPSSPPPPMSPSNESDAGLATPTLGPLSPEDEDPTIDIESPQHLPALFRSPSPSTIASGSGHVPEPQTPRLQRAGSVEPIPSSPMSTVDVTPLKPKTNRGRPTLTPQTRRLKQTVRTLGSTALGAEKDRKAQEHAQKRACERQLAAEHAAKEDAERQAAIDAESTRRAQEVARLITTSDADGGFNFENLEQFFDALWRKGGDSTISSLLTRYVQRHGSEHVKGMFRRSKDAKEQYISAAMTEIYHQGRAIQYILTRGSTTTITDLLKEFSMEQLAAEIQAKAPHLWAALTALADPDQSTRREGDGENRRNKGLVFTTICALISVLRSQKANNFQLVIGLFLLGSGASKREMEVLAHAGLSVSYTAIITHVKELSKEGLANIREVVKSGMVIRKKSHGYVPPDSSDTCDSQVDKSPLFGTT